MLSGIDHTFKKSDGIPIRYVFRFHLNPKLIAIKTINRMKEYRNKTKGDLKLMFQKK